MISTNKLKEIKRAGMAAVILAESIGSVEVIRALGKQNIPCIVIGYQYHHKSKYTTVALQVRSRQELEDLLLLLPQMLDVKLGLFTDSDEYLDIIFDNWEELSDFYHFPAAQQNKALMDKERLNEVSEFVHLPITFKSIEEINSDHCPIIIKPLWHDRKFSSLEERPEKAYICSDLDQVHAAANRLKGLGVPFITQQMIEGGPETIFTVLLYRGENGKVEVGYVSRKLRTYPLDYGIGSANSVENNDELVEQSISLLHLTDFVGVAEFEYKYCKMRSKYYLIEVNGRFPLQSSILNRCNPHFIRNIWCDLFNLPEEGSIVMEPSKGVLWLFFLNDIRAIKAEKQGSFLSILLKSFLSYRIQGALWNKSDPLPAIYFLKYVAEHLISKYKKSELKEPKRKPLKL